VLAVLKPKTGKPNYPGQDVDQPRARPIIKRVGRTQHGTKTRITITRKK